MSVKKRNNQGVSIIDFMLGAFLLFSSAIGLSYVFIHYKNHFTIEYKATKEANAYYRFIEASLAYVDENLQNLSSPGVTISCSTLTSSVNPSTGQSYLSSQQDCNDSFGEPLQAYVSVVSGGKYNVPQYLLVYPVSYDDVSSTVNPENNTMGWGNAGAKRQFYVSVDYSLQKLLPMANIAQINQGDTSEYNPVESSVNTLEPLTTLLPNGGPNITIDTPVKAGWFAYYPLYCEQTFVSLANKDAILWSNTNPIQSSGKYTLPLQSIYNTYFSKICSYQQYIALMYRQYPPYAALHAQTAGSQGSNNGGYGGITAGYIPLINLAQLTGSVSNSGYGFYVYVGQSNGSSSAIYVATPSQNQLLISAGGGGANGNTPANPSVYGLGGGNGLPGTSGQDLQNFSCGSNPLSAGGGGYGSQGIGGTGGYSSVGYTGSGYPQYQSQCSVSSPSSANGDYANSSNNFVANGGSTYSLGGQGYGGGGGGGEALCVTINVTYTTNCPAGQSSASCTVTTTVSCSYSSAVAGAGGGGSYVANGFIVDNTIGGVGMNSQPPGPNGWAKLWLQLQ